MANKRKATTAIVAGVTALALVLGGTFAWTSISQQARNEAIVDINPGGRLHDDFNGANKDVYVENFGDALTGVDIFARIRLDQYVEIGQDAGKNLTSDMRDRNVSALIGADANDVTTWETYIPDGAINGSVSANQYWSWKLGYDDDSNLPYYMPTFNVNKDSLQADINGTWQGTVEDDIVYYDNYKVYTDGQVEDGTEVFDWDTDINEEDGGVKAGQWDDGGITVDDTTPIDDADVYHKENQTHTAKQISTIATVITMEQWLNDYNGELGNYWVYDTDGWAYWANPIAPGETTGLLMDSVTMSKVPDENWYFGINVVGEFATASDIYEFEEMSPAAKQLVEQLTGKVEEAEMLSLTLDNYNDNAVFAPIGTPVKIMADNYDYASDDGSELTTDISSLFLVYYDGESESGEPNPVLLEESQYTYENDVLTIVDETLSGIEIMVRDKTAQVWGWIYCWDENQVAGDSALSVDGNIADENGYIYLSGLERDTINTFEVVVDESMVTLAENGLTATFHEDGIIGTTFEVDEEDPYRATLSIAANDYNSLTITALYEDGTSETVTVVPIYTTIVITPDMDGTTLYLDSGYYTLIAQDFSGDVSWSLDGANRSKLEVMDASQKMSVSSYESGTDITLTAEDASNTSATVTIKVVQASPYDGPLYYYYIQGSGLTYGYPLVEDQDYYWSQSDADSDQPLTYELSVGMTNDFNGKVSFELKGVQTGTDGNNAAGFIGEDGTLGLTSSGEKPDSIRVTTGQTKPFTIKINITGIDGEKYETTEYNHEIYIYPLPEDVTGLVRHVTVNCDDETYANAEEEGENKPVVYLAPGDSTTVTFDYMGSDTGTLKNDNLTWYVSDGNYTISEDGEDNRTATLTHNCSTESCTCEAGAVVQVKIGGMDYTINSDFEIYPYEDPTPSEDEETLILSCDGTVESTSINVEYDGTTFAAGDTLTITVDGYEASAFTWSVVSGGTYAVDGQSGVFTHYGTDTDQYRDCNCETVIRAELTDNSETWFEVTINCD